MWLPIPLNPCIWWLNYKCVYGESVMRWNPVPGWPRFPAEALQWARPNRSVAQSSPLQHNTHCAPAMCVTQCQKHNLCVSLSLSYFFLSLSSLCLSLSLYVLSSGCPVSLPHLFIIKWMDFVSLIGISIARKTECNVISLTVDFMINSNRPRLAHVGSSWGTAEEPQC